VLAGCQGVPTRPAQPLEQAQASEPPPARALPFEEPAAATQELDEDLVFSYLVGEIGARAGQLRIALTHYLHAAMLARDPYAAERATRIAIRLKDYEQGLRAARRWVELAPNSLAARQLSGILFLRNGQPQLAREQFQAVLLIAESLGKDGMLQVAVALNGERDRAAVLQLMRELLQQRAEDARAHYALAVVETGQQRYVEAEASLREAIRIQPEWAQPRVLLSRVLVALGRAQQGLRHLAAAVQDYPDDRLLRISYARLLVSSQQYAEALEQFRQLHERALDDVEVTYGYAMLATQQNAWEEARSLWQELRNRPKYREEATYFLAQVEELSGNPELAIGLYRSVSDEEFQVDAVMRMGSLLADRGQLAQAREAFAQARIAHPERVVDLYLAETQVLQNAGAPRETVLGLYALAIQAFPEDNDLRYNRGLYYSDIAEYALMEADFKAVLARDADNANALNALGYMLADLGQRLDEAYSYISRALKLKPDNPAILDSLGWVYYRMGDYANALKYLRRAAAGEPDDEISAHLGEVLWVSGERDEARSVWNKALEFAPESEQLRSVMDRFLTEP